MQNQSLYKVATAQLHLFTVLCNVKPKKMCKFYTKFITASKVLVVPELFFAHFERGMWLTLVTSFKQISDATAINF
jgi:hypothetical protein